MTLESAAFIYCTLAVIVFIDPSSLFGNALVGIAIFRNARLRTLTNYFVVGLALSDFLMAFFVMTSTAIALIAEGWVLAQQGCLVMAYLTITLSSISLHTMAFTAANRYVRIVRPEKYAAMFTKTRTILMNAYVWVYGFVYGAVYIWASGGEVIYIKNVGSCFPRKLPLAVCLLGYLVPSIVIFVCYLSVFRTVKAQLDRIAPSLHRVSGGPNVEEVKITRTLFAVVIGFLLCWVPLLVIGLIIGKVKRKLPFGFQAAGFVLIHLNSTINPVIYGIMNRTFREEYTKIFTTITNRLRRRRTGDEETICLRPIPSTDSRPVCVSTEN